MSRKKFPGSALTIEESVPGDSRSTDVTNPPLSLFTSAEKNRSPGSLVAFRVLVIRKESPVIPKTVDCLFPLPLVVLTTFAPGHSESGGEMVVSGGGVVV